MLLRPRRAATWSRRSAAEVEPRRDDGRDPPLRARAGGRRGEALEGDAGPALDRHAPRAGRRAHRRGAARDGDGRGVRARPQAVRPADRRLPGGVAPLRADAARGRRARARRPTTPPGPRTPSRRRSPLAASMAKAYASDAGWRVCASSLQVHGGIGFTWEHDLHFFLKRAKVDGLLYGSAERAPRDASRSCPASEAAASVASEAAASGESTPWRSCSCGRSRRDLGSRGWDTTWRTGTAVSFSSRSREVEPEPARRRRWGAWRPRSRRTPSGPRPPSPRRSGRGRRRAPFTFSGRPRASPRARRAAAPPRSRAPRGISRVKRHAPRSARLRSAASSSSEVAVTLATTRTWNSQAMCSSSAQPVCVLGTSLPEARRLRAARGCSTQSVRGSSAAPARGPGSARGARSRARSRRAGAISRSPSTRAGWSAARPAISVRIRLRSWSAKWGSRRPSAGERPRRWARAAAVGALVLAHRRESSYRARVACTGISSVIASMRACCVDRDRVVVAQDPDAVVDGLAGVVLVARLHAQEVLLERLRQLVGVGR